MMFSLKLEVLSDQRTLAYKHRKPASSKRKRGHKKIEAQTYEDLWKFKEEFWADELGEYTFALNSKCKKRI